MKDEIYIPPVVCAANRRSDGVIVCAPRHYDPTMRAIMTITGGRAVWIGSEQGFIDSNGNFLTREEAHVRATQLGQFKYRCGGDRTTLFSENLY